VALGVKLRKVVAKCLFTLWKSWSKVVVLEENSFIRTFPDDVGTRNSRVCPGEGSFESRLKRKNEKEEK